LSYFKQLVFGLVGLKQEGKTVFDQYEMAKIIEYGNGAYFDSYSLFRSFLLYEQESEDVFVKVNVDTPTTLPPLEDAKFLGKIVTEEEQVAIEEEKRRMLEEEEEKEYKRLAEEEERRLAYEEEWMGLDEQTI
jgi:hypothetical protein